MFAQMSLLQHNMIGACQSFRRIWVTFPSILLVTLLEMLLAGLCVVEACFSMKADVVVMKKREMHACWARLCKACGSQSSLFDQHPPESKHPSRQPRLTCVGLCKLMPITVLWGSVCTDIVHGGPPLSRTTCLDLQANSTTRKNDQIPTPGDMTSMFVKTACPHEICRSLGIQLAWLVRLQVSLVISQSVLPASLVFNLHFRHF